MTHVFRYEILTDKNYEQQIFLTYDNNIQVELLNIPVLQVELSPLSKPKLRKPNIKDELP